MNGSGEFDVRLKFVPEPNAGTPRKRCWIFASSALPAGARTASEGGRVNRKSWTGFMHLPQVLQIQR